ncbi:hypothetical protein B0T21DRAFT_441125 [Apiosordaria backusii]|uniref:Uncharacterized protein n=1 Tax=Apiosordaria backusii TaxID=314023 RepID=A0AA40BLR5_9PEZI|nr:hypothetical protein B0T21DRAFT_441125 [Apiosordaria backusii]
MDCWAASLRVLLKILWSRPDSQQPSLLAVTLKQPSLLALLRWQARRAFREAQVWFFLSVLSLLINQSVPEKITYKKRAKDETTKSRKQLHRQVTSPIYQAALRYYPATKIYPNVQPPRTSIEDLHREPPSRTAVENRENLHRQPPPRTAARTIKNPYREPPLRTARISADNLYREPLPTTNREPPPRTPIHRLLAPITCTDNLHRERQDHTETPHRGTPKRRCYIRIQEVEHVRQGAVKPCIALHRNESMGRVQKKDYWPRWSSSV